MRGRSVLFLAAYFATCLALPAPPAGAQSANFADLHGLAVEASWIERYKWRYVGQDKTSEIPSPRTLTLSIGKDGTVTHSITRMAGGSTITTDGEGPLGTVVSRGKFKHSWSFEDGKLIYVETLIEGARRLVVSFKKTGDQWTCSLSANLWREQGKGKVISIHLGDGKPVEMTDISMQKGECKIRNS